MRAMRYAAVDLGASSGRGLVGHLKGGRLRTRSAARFENEPVTVPVSGARRVLHWDVLRLWRGVCDGLGTAGRGGPVRSVGIDTWAVDYGLLDADGALLGNPVHYRDDRTAGVPERFFDHLGAADHYALTGSPGAAVHYRVPARRSGRNCPTRRRAPAAPHARPDRLMADRGAGHRSDQCLDHGSAGRRHPHLE